MMNRRIDQFLYQKEKPIWEKILLSPLTLLSLPYGGVVRTRSFFYSIGLFKTKRLPCPVISVGNITVGGTGKTPFVMALAKGMMKKGIPVAILSRGYKRRKTSPSIVSDGQRIFLSLEESGDEPLLMAKACQGIPILVGKNRFVNGQIALQRFGVKGLLLDDAYQHLPLYRNINILLIDSKIGFGDQHLLPRGILREPLSSLRRASFLVLTKVEDIKRGHDLQKKIHHLHPSLPIFHSYYEPVGLIGPNGEQKALEVYKGKRVLAFSGIAQSNYFISLLKKSGMEVAREMTYPDHHLYRAEDLNSIEEMSKGMDGVVTTEKDMVKLKEWKIPGIPLFALRIEVQIWEEEAFYEKVMEIF
ncbi:MAG: tetraacyldisaccharide 4'-kinase [Syntrophaceae bacterium]|nr:tetraacyldisaccharide 4'-kinase [Syntrophaceae bacterium]